MAVEYMPHKTKNTNPQVIKVYLTKTAIEILERYKHLPDGRILPLISRQEYNRAIKKVMHHAGINRMVTVYNTLTRESEKVCIADVASSHMARRTFIGNIYKKVKDPNLVGKLSGHKEGSRAFARYRNIDDSMLKDLSEILEAK